MSFLPEGYSAPKSSNNYMKLEDGENRVRILSAPILGWEDWVDNKPVRYKMDQKPAKSSDPKKPLRHFWSFIVWNYMEERIQIMHLTQATIRSNIEALCKDAEWGDPFFYDIKIIRKGEGVDTEYMVNPLPHKPLNQEIKNKFHESPCNLEALFMGGDPFSTEWERHTPGIFDKEGTVDTTFDLPEKPKMEKISKAQEQELQDIFQECDVKERLDLLKGLKLESLANVSTGLFQPLKKKLEKMRDEMEAKRIEKELLNV